MQCFRQVLELKVEFSAEELESQLLTPGPGDVLKDIHITLLRVSGKDCTVRTFCPVSPY